MHCLAVVLALLSLACQNGFSLSIEEAKEAIEANKNLEKSEQTRQIAGLYRLSGQAKKSFELLKTSLEEGVFNEWMLEDFSALGTSLKRENVVRSTAHKLIRGNGLKNQMGGMLLESLADLKKTPEQVLETLRKFSSSHIGEEVNGLFLLLLQRAYSAMGNVERSQYFASLMSVNFPNYYLLTRASLTQIKPASFDNHTILQVGSFKAGGGGVKNFLEKLKRLGLEPQEETSRGNIRIRLTTLEPEETVKILRKEGIDFYVVQGSPLLSEKKLATLSPLQPKSTIQAGIFSSSHAANAHKESLAKDGFNETRVLWQEDNGFFYVFLQSLKPEATLKSLKAKGYDAFIKNLE